MAEAAGAAPSASPPLPPAWPVEEVVATDSQKSQGELLAAWAKAVTQYVDHDLLKFLRERAPQVPFPVPTSLMLIPPLSVSDAASGAQLSAFREAMTFDNLHHAFRKTGQYEAAGTVWMLDALADGAAAAISVSQLEGAMGTWSEARYTLSSDHPPSRRYSFDVPLPPESATPRWRNASVRRARQS